MYDINSIHFLINNSIITVNNFYKGIKYIIDISDISLQNKLFIIIDKNNRHYYKNIIQTGKLGIHNSSIEIYIDSSETLDDLYQIKYIKNNEDFFTFTPFYYIKDTPVYFT